MPTNYNSIDAHWSWNGDFAEDGGDLQDTSDDHIKSLLQEIHTICASTLNDWKIYPKRAAGLDDYVGEPNTKSSAASIKSRLQLALTSAGVVRDADLAIRVIPVHIYKVLIIVGVNALSTENNSLLKNQVVTSFIFNTTEHQVVSLDKPLDLGVNS